MKAGSWTSVRKVDFGANGAQSFMLRAKGTGKLEIRTARTGKALATVEFSSTSFEDHIIEIDPATFKGVKSSIFFVFTESTNVQFDAWQFSEEMLAGIKDNKMKSTNSGKGTYDLNGRRMSGQMKKGIYVIDGEKRIVK